MQTTDSNLLFKTDASLAKEEEREKKLIRTKSIGDPIQLPSKVLAFEIDGQDAWTAESGFVLRRLSLQTGETLKVFKGHSGPVTSLALHTTPASSAGPARKILISGSWDKSIKVWDRETGALLSTTITHTDFVKTLLVLKSSSGPSILVSGSSDKSIAFHSLADVSSTLPHLLSLKIHARPVTRLITLASYSSEPSAITSWRICSADSMGSVRVWDVATTPDGSGVTAKEITVAGLLGNGEVNPKTSVTDLAWSEGDQEDEDEGAGLWISSVDQSVTFHPYLPKAVTSSTRPVSLPTLPTSPLALLPVSPTHILTGSADEHLRLFNSETKKLMSTIEGHCADVNGLRKWDRIMDDGSGVETWVVSSSLDCTLRRWSLKDLFSPPPPPPVEEKEDDLMTEEERRELEELMADD